LQESVAVQVEAKTVSNVLGRGQVGQTKTGISQTLHNGLRELIDEVGGIDADAANTHFVCAAVHTRATAEADERELSQHRAVGGGGRNLAGKQGTTRELLRVRAAELAGRARGIALGRDEDADTGAAFVALASGGVAGGTCRHAQRGSSLDTARSDGTRVGGVRGRGSHANITVLANRVACGGGGYRYGNALAERAVETRSACRRAGGGGGGAAQTLFALETGGAGGGAHSVGGGRADARDAVVALSAHVGGVARSAGGARGNGVRLTDSRASGSVGVSHTVNTRGLSESGLEEADCAQIASRLADVGVVSAGRAGTGFGGTDDGDEAAHASRDARLTAKCWGVRAQRTSIANSLSSTVRVGSGRARLATSRRGKRTSRTL
jgi:hypothetical protein